MVTRHQASSCPNCCAPLNSSTAMEEPQTSPTPGCATVCAYCGFILEYGENLSLSIMTEQVWSALSAEQKELLLSIRESVLSKKLFRPDQFQYN